MKEKISKRQFLKKGSLAFCGLSCGIFTNDIFADSSNFSNSRINLGDFDSKFSIEAKYYIQTPKGIKCQLCPNVCNIKENEVGECRTRINKNGQLICFAYGNPCAVHIDPIEKKPLYHFYPGSKIYSIATAGCNLACLNCQNWEISQSSPLDTRNYNLLPDKLLEDCKSQKCNSIAYTYSDPVAFYEYTLETSKIAKAEGIKNVLVSAGYINEEPLKEWCKYIDAANIDLKSFSNDVYEMLNAGTLEPVLNTLKILQDNGVWLEITNLIVPNWTDDLDMIKKMCDWLVSNGFQNQPLHFSRFHPQYKLTNLPVTPLNTLTRAKEIATSAGLNYVYIGNVPGNDYSNTYCPNCNRKVIDRKGYKILQKNISMQKCNYCKTTINGIWQ